MIATVGNAARTFWILIEQFEAGTQCVPYV